MTIIIHSIRVSRYCNSNMNSFSSKNGIIFKIHISHPIERKLVTQRWNWKKNIILCQCLWLFLLQGIVLMSYTQSAPAHQKEMFFFFINTSKCIKNKKWTNLFCNNQYQLPPIFLIVFFILFPYQARNREKRDTEQKPRQVPWIHAVASSWNVQTMKFRVTFTF